YVKETKTGKLEKVIFVDRKNQNISTLEQDKNIWKIRSMNPVTTGVDAPPHKFMTSLGAFLVLAKEEEVPYLVDGTTDIGGYFHFALRFNGGVYLHGVPIDLPETKLKEYSKSLGTVPESHMCVRNATSHAKFMFNWAEPFQSIVFVIR
ncbi:MAG: L,D-transpeptidase, partial [Fusobacteriaceae bacterium]